MLGQAVKGGSEDENGQTSMTGRSAELGKEAQWLRPTQRVTLHFLHCLAFPQQYSQATVQESLPAAFGGLDAPWALDPSEVWGCLKPIHRRLILGTQSNDPKAAVYCSRILNRRVRNPKWDPDTLEALTNQGKAAVAVFNEVAEEYGDEPIPIWSFYEALEDVRMDLATRSTKSRYSDSLETTLPSIVSKEERTHLLSMFVPLDRFDISRHQRDLLMELKQKGALPVTVIKPKEDHERVMWRMRRVPVEHDLIPPESEDPPVGRTPYEWLYGCQRQKDFRAFVRKEDYERLKPPAAFSTDVSAGILLAGRQIELVSHRATTFRTAYRNLLGWRYQEKCARFARSFQRQPSWDPVPVGYEDLRDVFHRLFRERRREDQDLLEDDENWADIMEQDERAEAISLNSSRHARY
jgi:hypothetical protein